MGSIITGRPPNFDQIAARFPAAQRTDVLFAYEPDIYNPAGAILPAWLIEHEATHVVRQRVEGPAVWWTKYCSDPDFVYKEELLAHAAEYRVRARMAPSRNERRALIKITAQRLAAPMYQHGRSLSIALRDLKQEVA